VTEGVHSIGPGPRPSAELEIRGHALGWLTPADLLSLLEVKYDVITGMLYTEMLRQHYGRESPLSIYLLHQRLQD